MALPPLHNGSGRTDFKAVAAMQAIFLLNDRRFRRNIDALLRTFGIAELAADTGICDKITSCTFCAAKSKAGTLNRLFGQVKPFSAAFIDAKTVSALLDAA